LPASRLGTLFNVPPPFVAKAVANEYHPSQFDVSHVQ